MTVFGLPTEAEINGITYAIRSDFRDILGILVMMQDPEMTDQDKALAAMMIFFPDFDTIPAEDYEEAVRWCYWFIDGGEEPDRKHGPRLMDWEQDYSLIIAPVNRVLGYEARGKEYVHWWTFLAAYKEIGDCTFARVVGIRDKRRRGKKLDKLDQEFLRENPDLINLKPRYTAADNDLLAEWGGGSK